MKVYVLTTGYLDDAEISGVYSTWEKAVAANQALNIRGCLTEVELDEVDGAITNETARIDGPKTVGDE